MESQRRADNKKPERHMGKSDELAHILKQHRRWLESGKSSGQRADLSGANLDGINLAGADLSGAVLAGASLCGADFSNALLIHADFSEANLRRANFANANLILADFTGADLNEANLSHTTSAESREHGHMSRGPRFRDADLQHANLQACYCYISDFSGAKLAGASCSGAALERANLSNNNLAGIDFSAATLLNADLSQSDLSGANLSGAELVHANLSDTTLSSANIARANLQAANFANAKVDGIRYDRKTRFKGIRVNSCYGSARFRRHAQDQDFIEELREAHPLFYTAWLVLTDCGRSMLLVVSWCLALAVIFGLIYFGLGENAFEIANKETLRWNVFTTIYYSVVTFTTLGFGDITPRTPIAAAAVMLEVVVGYMMLGILISILATKVARRS